MNYLALLGWSVDEEIFDFRDKIRDFDPRSISNKAVIFDYEKLEWINGKHLREIPLEKLMTEFELWLRYTEKFDFYEKLLKDSEYSKQVISICREKINTMSQLLDFSAPFFSDELEYESRFVDKYLKKSWSTEVLEAAIRRFEENDDWSIEGVEKVIRDVSEEKHTSKKNTFQTIRGAVTGRLVTPGLFETVAVLGKEKTLERLEATLDLAESLKDEEGI